MRQSTSAEPAKHQWRLEGKPAGTQAGRTLDLILLHGEQGQVVGAREVAVLQVAERQEALAGRHGARVGVDEVVDVAQRVGLREPSDAALRSACRRDVSADSKNAPPPCAWTRSTACPSAAGSGQRLGGCAAQEYTTNPALDDVCTREYLCVPSAP